MKKFLSSLVVTGLLCSSLSAETYFDYEDGCNSEKLKPFIEKWYKKAFLNGYKVVEIKDMQEEEIPKIYEYVKEEFKDIKYCTFVRTLETVFSRVSDNDMEKPKKTGFWLIKTGENPKVFNEENLKIVKNTTIFIPLEGNKGLNTRVDLNEGYTAEGID